MNYVGLEVGVNNMADLDGHFDQHAFFFPQSKQFTIDTDESFHCHVCLCMDRLLNPVCSITQEYEMTTIVIFL